MTLDFEFIHKERNNTAILLFHGMTGSPFELKKYGQFLFSQGFDVFAHSLPGHGKYAASIRAVEYKDWLNSARQDFERLKYRYENVFVSGLCLGAVLSLAIAEEFNRKVAGVIALSTTLFLDGWRMPWYSFLMPIGLSTLIRYYYTYPECEPYGIKNIKTRRIIKKLLEKSDVGLDNFPMTCIYELLKLSAITRKKLKKITCPILIIHSKEDDLASKKSAELVFNKISSRKKDLIILQDSFHMVLYDNEKDFVCQTSSRFIKSCLNASEWAQINDNKTERIYKQ